MGWKETAERKRANQISAIEQFRASAQGDDIAQVGLNGVPVTQISDAEKLVHEISRGSILAEDVTKAYINRYKPWLTFYLWLTWSPVPLLLIKL